MDVEQQQPTLMRYALVSLAAAVATIALKVTAAAVTGSVGLLSDALESGVNLVAALVALWALRLSGRPPDPVHQFGHGKAEYVSATVEGGMVVLFAAAIIWAAIPRLVDPAPLEQAGLGLAISRRRRWSTSESASRSCAPGDATARSTSSPTASTS